MDVQICRLPSFWGFDDLSAEKVCWRFLGRSAACPSDSRNLPPSKDFFFGALQWMHPLHKSMCTVENFPKEDGDMDGDKDWQGQQQMASVVREKDEKDDCLWLFCSSTSGKAWKRKTSKWGLSWCARAILTSDLMKWYFICLYIKNIHQTRVRQNQTCFHSCHSLNGSWV